MASGKAGDGYMNLSRNIAFVSALALLVAPRPVFAADPIRDQTTKIDAARSRVGELEQRLSSLLAEMTKVDADLAAASGRLGRAQIVLTDAETRLAEAKLRMQECARRAYMSGGARQIAVLFKAESFSQFVGYSRALGRVMSADTKAYRRLMSSRDALVDERSQLGADRQVLLDATRRLASVRAEIRAALASEQAVLKTAQAELDRLLAARRRASSVSPEVEARRAARQKILDQRLAALLAWYAPGAGPEPYLPANLKGTGISTSGLSSWYGPGFDGRRASSGATYHQDQLTAASLILPFGTLLKVTYAGRSVVVVITDRGPYVAGRVLDLSWGAAKYLGLSGVKEIQMEIVVPSSPAPAFP